MIFIRMLSDNGTELDFTADNSEVAILECLKVLNNDYNVELYKKNEKLLAENQELKKQLEEKERQQEKFIKYLNWQIKSCRYTYETYGPGNINIHYAAAHEVDLDNYKKIIGNIYESEASDVKN